MSGLPSIKRFKQGDRLYVQAQRIWLILVSFTMQHQKRHIGSPPTITYGELALLMGYDDPRAGHMLGRQLGIVGDLCIANDLPALNAIVVGAATGEPGAEVVLTPGRNHKQEQRAVMQQDWYELRVPTTGMFREIWEG